jgi:hypothetical protein
MDVKIRNFRTLLAKMAETEEALGRQFQSLSIIFACAVNTKLASLFVLAFSLQVYIELTATIQVITQARQVEHFFNTS